MRALHLSSFKQNKTNKCFTQTAHGYELFKKGWKNIIWIKNITCFASNIVICFFFWSVCVRLYWHAAEFLSMLSWPVWWTLTTAAKDKLPLDSRRTNTLYFSWLDLNLAYYASCVNDWKHELSWSSLRLTSTEKYTLILSFSHTQSNNTDWTSSPSLNKNVCACRKYDIV